MTRRTAVWIKTTLLPLALLGLLGRAEAQELIAWPIGGQQVYRALPFVPGTPPGPRPNPFPGNPPNPPQTTGTPPMNASGYNVTGTIDGRVANLKMNIAFQNPTSQRMEGVLLIPIPADTVLNGFEMTVGGKEMKAELLEAGQASTIYEGIVRQMKDPGLLELAGERMVRARVFPIEPNSQVLVQFSMSQMLKSSGGLTALRVPLRSAKMANATAAGASVRLTLNAPASIRTLYSPEADVRIERSGEREAVIEYRSSGREQGADLSLFWSMQQDPLAAGLLTFKEEGEDGFFLLSVSPKADPAQKALPKDVVFIVDRSGSMNEQGKMEQAKKAILYCLSRLSEGDRFGVVDFASDSGQFSERLVEASTANKERARRYVEQLDASGGTNIEAGLKDGLALLRKADGRVPMVFFMTDGLPTAGKTDMAELLRQAGERNEALRARVFSFGVGSDVNTLFLDKLAEGNRGAHDYVQPGEDIEHKVSSLYQKVAKPALTDVKIEWKGVEAAQVYPRPITDLFYGSELTLMGRYKAHGKGTLVVTGQAGDKPARFEFPVELPQKARSNAFLPKLWANLKVTHELDAVRLSGRTDPEVIKDIVSLAKRYGIVTPYTSFLITEDGATQQQARVRMERQAMELHQAARESGFRADAAKKAQAASQYMMAASGRGGAGGGYLSGASGGASPAKPAAAPPAMASMQAALADAEEKARDEEKALGRRTVETKTAGGKTFYRREGRWVDGQVETLGAVQTSKTVTYMSPEYFELLRRVPELGRYFALGDEVTVLHGGTVYKVVKR